MIKQWKLIWLLNKCSHMCRCWGALLTSDRMLWLLVLVTPIRHALLLFPEKGIPPHQHSGSFSGTLFIHHRGFPRASGDCSSDAAAESVETTTPPCAGVSNGPENRPQKGCTPEHTSCCRAGLRRDESSRAVQMYNRDEISQIPLQPWFTACTS